MKASDTIAIVGARGMLGQAWQRLLTAHGVGHLCLDLGDIDIADRASVERVLQPSLRVIINCAAYTDVDGAEQDEAGATRVNGIAPGYLAERCRAIGARLVHYSTDYVFDGKAKAPYAIDAPLAPLNAYGRSKAEGERRILAAGCEHLILRTSWLYAPWGKNFVTTMARLCTTQDALRVVDDQRGRPTSAIQLAEASWRLLQLGASGVLHVTDGGECTWYELAVAVATCLRAPCHIEPCTSAEFPRPAPRPAYSVLDLAPAEKRLGTLPDWRHNLEATLADWVQSARLASTTGLETS